MIYLLGLILKFFRREGVELFRNCQFTPVSLRPGLPYISIVTVNNKLFIFSMFNEASETFDQQSSKHGVYCHHI